MIISALFDLIFGRILGILLIPIFCLVLLPYYLVKALYGKKSYLENLQALYKISINKQFFSALSIKESNEIEKK